MSYTRRSYPTQTPKSTSASQAIDDSKKTKSSLLKDSSWIKRDDEEDEPVDRDPNHAKAVLGSRYRSSETLDRSEPVAVKSPTSKSASVQALSKRFTSQDELNKIRPEPEAPKSKLSSVQALSKRFSSQDELNKSSTLPARTSYTRSTPSALQPDPPKTMTPKTSPTSNTFKDRVFSDGKSSNKGTTYPSLPTKSTKVTETTEVKVIGKKTSEDELFDTLIPKSIKDDYTTPDSKTNVSKTETATVKSSKEGDSIKTTPITKKSSTPEDDLYDSLLPKSITSGIPSRPSITKREIDRVESVKGPEDDLFDSLLPKSITSGIPSRPSIPKREIDRVESVKGPEDDLFDSLLPKSITSGIPSRPSIPKREIDRVESVKGPEDDLYDSLLPKSITSGIPSRPSIPKREIDRVESVKGPENDLYDSLLPKSITSGIPSRPSIPKREIDRVESVKGPEDDLYDSLLPKSITSGIPSRPSIPKREIDRVESVKGPENDLYDSLLPKSITSGIPSRPSITKREIDRVDSGKGYSNSDDTPSTRTLSPKPSYDYPSVTSPTSPTKPTVYTPKSYKDSSRDEDLLKEPRVTPSSPRTVYSTPERAVLEKDLCSYCRKPFNSEAKMVLEEMKINCHASCFKCEVCNNTLGHLKAGDSLWIYKRAVHCDNCFDVTRERWRQ